METISIAMHRFGADLPTSAVSGETTAHINVLGWVLVVAFLFALGIAAWLVRAIRTRRDRLRKSAARKRKRAYRWLVIFTGGVIAVLLVLALLRSH